MNIDHVLHLLDEFALAMRDQAKNIASGNGASAMLLNQQRERLREAIRELADPKTPQEARASADAAQAITAAAAQSPKPAPVTSSLTTDPNDPRLTRGVDDKPVPQAEVYLVLSEEERAKGFVRPFRDMYRHTTCRTVTTMGRALSETYARDPAFYGGTYCVHCRMHKPVAEFRWLEPDGSEGPVVGT